ncbi:MAG TPA: isocitrate lyase/phosphoenolpyruvate mutase family protein [Mycobacterium sp.]|nr:isocitrate lyase/phosphoenolpyruvate mutase family protein [Mycobacterium sp.]
MVSSERYEAFMALHTRPGGFVMPNAWDGLSALILKKAGFEALGTSSAALAAALGRLDGRHAVSRGEHLAHARLLAGVSGLPINGDFEDGYGDSPDDVAVTVQAAIDAGLAGIGVEDTSGDPSSPIRDFDDAVARVRAAARAARGRIVLTGRTDNFLHGRDDVDDTIRRLTAFAEAGADVLYATNPPDLIVVRAIVEAVAPKPVNVVRGTGAGIVTVAELQKAGVKRISMGSALYTHAAAAVRDAAARLAAGDIAAATTGMSFAEMTSLIADAGSGG